VSDQSIEALVPRSVLEPLVEGIAKGEYSLLLGSGASLGGTGGGRPLPDGDQLRNEIVEDFDVPTAGASISLADAYEAAATRATKDGKNLTTYIRQRFQNCIPAPWLRKLSSFTWRRAWTLNIDDSFETAYSEEGTRQEVSQILWDEVHSDPEPNELQVVHLHGSALEPGRLVFSIVEYFNATTSSHAWHRIFADHYQERPFIIIGATLRQEFDLAQVIRRGSQSNRLRGRPSIIVAPSFQPLQLEFVQRHGLVPISLSGESFLDQVTPQVREVEKQLKALTFTTGAILPVEAQSFLEEFTGLTLEAVPPKRPRDFYLGYDPTWYDILLDKDAVFEVTHEVLSSLKTERDSGNPTQRLELVSGPWGTGKTTALLRIGRELLQTGEDVYLFRGEAALDPEATAWWLSRRPKSVLLFDGVADFAPEIETVLQSCRQAGIRAHMVGTERHQRLRKVKAAISREFLRLDGRREMKTMSDADIASLLQLLEERSRLGRITRRDKSGRFAYFARAHRRQLFSAMSDLEGGPGFLERLTNEFSSTSLAAPYKDALSICAFTYEFGYAVPLGILTHATGLSSADILASADTGVLSEWIDVSPQGLRLRHRHIATLLVERVLTSAERYRLSQQLARSLAPQVDRDAISRRTLPFRIVRHILDAGIAHRWMGDSVVAWYAALSPEYSWNARYWEQRALAHLRLGDVATARSFAERAVDIYRDPFTQTTLAHVILKQFLLSLDSDDDCDLNEFGEAVELLRSARNGSLERDDYPYTVFFEGSIKILRHSKLPTEAANSVAKEFREWLVDAERSRLREYSEYSHLLDRQRREFFKLERKLLGNE
jgi:hypothetical protein